MSLEWFEIKDFSNYEITKDGKIRNKTTLKEKKISPSKRGYPVVSLRKDGKLYLRTIHVLLARQFIPNDNNLPQVNHIDGNKWNYSLENLEWTTAKENLLHARKTGLHKSDGQIPVIQYDTDMNFIKKYKSMSEASKQTGTSRSAIGKVAARKKKISNCGRVYLEICRIKTLIIQFITTQKDAKNVL